MQESAGPQPLRDWISRAARRDPAKPWIVSADDRRMVSYGQLHDLIRRIASVLRGRGIARNDRVALLADNSIEHLACYFGVMAYGATICTVHVEMNRNQLGDIFARLKPKLVLCQDGLKLDDLLAAVPAPRLRLGRLGEPAAETFFAEAARCAPSDAQTAARPDDAAVILFTSGTSARPKGVVLELRRAPRQHRPDRRGLRHHRRRPALRFPLVQLGVGAAPGRAGAGQPRRDAGHGAEILRQPLLPACLRAPRHGRGRQSNHHQFPAQRRAAAVIRPVSAALHHVELGAAHGRGMAAVRSEPSAFRSRKATARARPAGSRRFPANGGGIGTVGRPFAYHRSVRSSTATGGGCRPARSARSRSAALPRTPTATLPTTVASRLPAAAACSTGDLGFLDADGLFAPDRPREGADHPRRRQHLAGRDRRLPDAAVGGDRGRDRGRAGQGLRRGGGGLRGGAAGRAGRCERAAALLQRRRCRRSRRPSGSC